MYFTGRFTGYNTAILTIDIVFYISFYFHIEKIVVTDKLHTLISFDISFFVVAIKDFLSHNYKNSTPVENI